MDDPKEQQERLQTVKHLFNGLQDPVLGVDGEGNLQFFNGAALRLWGGAATAGEGLPLSALFDSESGSALGALCAKGFEGVGESSVSLKGGRKMSFSVSQLVGGMAFVVLRDNSRREHLEEELRDARRMASVGRLAAEIAHEINNPLAVIQGRLEMLRAIPDMDAAKRERHLDIVDQHSKRVARIVQNLQIFARPRKPEPEQLSLLDTVSQSIDNLGRRLERVQLVLDIPPEATIYADAELLALVWENLLVSTANIMGSGVALGVNAITDETGSSRVRIVCEAGGWPEELLGELRSPYSGGSYRVDPGRGLALAISWGIVQDHGGWMTAENEATGGASIEAYFPGPVASTEAAFSAVGAKPGWDVLVVDDDEVMAETVAWMLHSLGHRATAVHSAEDALARLDHTAFDVVLSDQRLPGMNGEAMLALIQSQWPDMASRTILTSGLLHRPRPGQVYLQKPFSSAQLKAVFEKIQ
jgi:nitrogen fixation/metabolism regulation signal transduction histidine kinase/CheY-like chemotaxis protein